jgi:hypothetical protein
LHKEFQKSRSFYLIPCLHASWFLVDLNCPLNSGHHPPKCVGFSGPHSYTAYSTQQTDLSVKPYRFSQAGRLYFLLHCNHCRLESRRIRAAICMHKKMLCPYSSPLQCVALPDLQARFKCCPLSHSNSAFFMACLVMVCTSASFTAFPRHVALLSSCSVRISPFFTQLLPQSSLSLYPATPKFFLIAMCPLLPASCLDTEFEWLPLFTFGPRELPCFVPSSESNNVQAENFENTLHVARVTSANSSEAHTTNGINSVPS